MPSRRAAACILVFWLSTMGLVLYRDVWPRLVASGPPPIAVDLSDEATQFVPVRWKVIRGGEAVGKLTTRMSYEDADDTFRFTAQYSHFRIDFPWARVVIPDVTTATRVTRNGDLREQTLDGKLVLQIRHGDDFLQVAEAKATVAGRVEAGVFRGKCEITSPVVNVKRDLEPAPVRGGQALNPLQPVNRIVGIAPGQRWVVQEIDPLGESLAALFREQIGKHGFALPELRRESLIAVVGSTPQPLRWGRGQAEDACWVIEYRGGEVRAKTWVRVADGKVIRQEATLMGEQVALEREE